MKTHVQIVAWIHIVLGVFFLWPATMGLGMMGGFGHWGPMGGAPMGHHFFFGPFWPMLGSFFVAVSLLFALPAIIAGIGLLSFKPWARILAIVVSILNLLNIPLGTLLGIYSLWVLLQRETEQLFQQSTSSA